jgi:hypothetical protein
MAIEIVQKRSESDEPFDMRALWRLGGWGAAAATALLLLAFVSASETGSQRLGLAHAPAELPVRPVTTVAVAPSANDADIKRLTAQVQGLAADRDRALARIAGLERLLDDLTGSIKRLADIPPTNTPPAAEPPATPKTSAAPVLKPTVSEDPSVRAPPALPALGKATPWPEPAKPADNSVRETLAPPEPAEEKVPLPPERVAAAEPASTASPEQPPQGEYGIALAGASSLDVARMQWMAVKANFGPMLANLQPRALSERRGTATHYRLVAGPLPTLTAASRLCARIIAAHAICQPVKFSGEPL